MTSGVYMLRHPITGDAYIGASRNLETRLRAWKSELTKARRHGYYVPRFGGAFEDISINDVEVRVLEHVDPEVLFEREAFWIKTLRPTLNVKGNRSVLV